MKLVYLQLADVRQFRRPLRLDGLTDGINLFVGPNESGKSTVADAIRAAFFERYKSRSVDYLQPWGDSSAGPEMEIAFDWKGERWVLNKRFLNKPRCDLVIGHEHLSETDAEDKLAELFGYQFALKGASRPEHQGIPGLLWVRQGSIQDISDPVSHAAEQLQSALGTSLGEVAASAGDELTNALEKERGQWLTRVGRPTGEYKIAIEACEAGHAKLGELDKKIAEYRGQVDELGRLREQRQSIDQPEPWRVERALASEAENRLREVRGWQSQQQQDQARLQGAERGRELCRQQARSFEDDTRQLAKRANAQAEAQTQVEGCQSRGPQLDAKLTQAKTAYEAAQTAASQAHQWAERARVQKEHQELAATLTRSRETLQHVRDLQNALAGLYGQHQANVIDEKVLAKLRRCRNKLDELAIRRESVATRLQFDLQPGKSVSIGADRVTGNGERLLLEATEVAIPKIGTLRLQPGGTDVAALVRDERRVQDQHDALLAELGVETLADGEQRLAVGKDLANQIGREEARLQGLAPAGADALAAQCKSDQERVAALAAKLDALPVVKGEPLDDATAQTALEAAQRKLKSVEQSDADLKRDLAIANQLLVTSTQEWRQLNSQLESPEYRARVTAVSNQLVTLNAEVESISNEMDARQQKIDAVQPEIMQQDVDRHTRSAEAMQRAATERKQAIDRLEVTLETLGAQGLEEARATLSQQVEADDHRCSELARRTAALDLLLGLLKGKRQALTRQLQAPLQKHLDHYLKLLFPHASLTVDENLTPEILTRQPATEPQSGGVQSLSYGTREQMGLISRFAYADLLREAGKPTLIILDDALVHSDPARLGQMKRILFDAATRHQVLLFSCHPDNWRDLGVPARELQTLKAAVA